MRRAGVSASPRCTPATDLKDVRAATGFDFDSDGDTPTTPVPDAETMALIRGPIGKALAEVYPRFAAGLLDERAA